jgi:hypothetical protein
LSCWNGIILLVVVIEKEEKGSGDGGDINIGSFTVKWCALVDVLYVMIDVTL